VDTTLLVVAAIATASVLLALFALIYARRLSRSVDLALARIGGEPTRRWWRRARTLEREVRVLEESVTESERDRSRLAAAAAEASIGILLTDDAGVVVFSNEAAAAYLGARHGEAVAETRMRLAIETAILNRRPEHREIEIFNPQRRHLDIRAVPLELGVESLGAVAYVEDITDSRRVDALRSDFIANVGHELTTPLGALATLAETLADQRDDPAVVDRMADRVAQESQRLSKLIGDILDLSQAEAAERPRAPVELSEVMAAVASDLRAAAAAAQVDLTIGTVPAGAVVWGERRQLQTMFTNLVDNAIKYTPPGASDRKPRVAIHTKASKQELVISVEDEGIGIGEEHLERVFERFYRADKGRSRETVGTGLGLSIARHIARNHGGDITLESQVGVGTVFRVHLPIWKEP